nr:unnamed protein product [Callosobruchus chinensis]
MEVNKLLGDDLTYELILKGLLIGNSVAEKRSLFRDALPQERLPKCATKLQELKEAIAHFDVENRENEFKRIYTRLLNVPGRLSRLGCEGDQVEERKVLMEMSMQLLGEVNCR